MTSETKPRIRVDIEHLSLEERLYSIVSGKKIPDKSDYNRLERHDGFFDDNLGAKATGTNYEKYYNNGFVFGRNCKKEDVEEMAREYESEGYEVFVGENAFDFAGEKVPEHRTILIRDRGVEKNGD